MKRTINMKNGVLALFCMAALAGLAACEADPVERDGGKQPDKGALEQVHLQLRSAKSTTDRSVVSLTEGTTTSADQIYCRLTQSVPTAVTVTAVADPSLVAAYNEQHGTSLSPLPAANAVIADEGKISIAAGQRMSDKIQVTFKSDGLAPGIYLLPISITSDDSAYSTEGRALYYGVKVRGLDLGEYELDTDYLNVFYLNTSKYQPLLAEMWLLEKTDGYSFETVWMRTYGNIVNLRINQIGYDAASGRAMLVLSPDMRYVLDHADKYIRPLQDKGRKVCLCIEGDGKGVGFCNLTDAQIADFTAQVKNVLDVYELDGVNLFDRNTGYGKEGMPEMNTTSYPKLIKALREALGREKLLTVSVYEKPTETFYDVDASGGIAVGEYIDYAWSGYNSDKEAFQLLDPWHPNLEYVSKYTQKPIAGLPKEKFGCMNCPIYGTDFSNNTEEFSKQDELVTNGFREWGENYKNSNILVYADLIANLQDKYEGYWDMYFTNWFRVMDPYCDAKKYKSRQRNSYNMDLTRWWEVEPGNSNYGKWVKDWD